MTLFELTFALSALILGLALTHMAATFHRLARAGRRVRWAPEPLLQAAIILLVLVFVWLNQWAERGQSSTVYWRILLQVLKLLVLYMAAAFCLPENPAETGIIDLHAYYDQTRRLSFGALVAGLVLFDVYAWTEEPHFHFRWAMLIDLVFAGPYVLLMFVRWRWLNVLLLAVILLYYGGSIMNYRLSG